MSALTDTSMPRSVDANRLAELEAVIAAYNQVTERLEASHASLNREVARLRSDLASANEALQRSRRLAALGEMAAGIAHEIRNPLASIHLYADMLGQDLADRPQQADTCGKIAEAVRGLDAIVNDVLTFSREMRLRPVPGSAAEALCRAVEAVCPMLEANGITVIEPTSDAMAAYDRDLLHQALVNLVRNAAEAMVAGGTLTLEVITEEGGCGLIVRDSGPGIAADAIDRIFNPFFTTRDAGTGLGLAIVHRILDAHGGSIAVHNDGGAVFVLTLPLACDASPDPPDPPAQGVCS